MTTLLLVPLEDVVVFPNMTVTLPVDVGDEERVLLVPVHEGEYASVGTVAEVVENSPPTRRRPRRRALRAPPRRRRRRAHRPGRQASCRGRGASRPGDGGRAYPRARAGVPGRRRGDPRGARRRRPDLRLRPLDHRGRRARRHDGLRARRLVRAEGRAARDARRSRAARARARRPARAAGRAPGSQAHPRRRRVRRSEAAAGVHPAPPDGVDPQGARRGRRLGRRRVPNEDRGGRHARGRAASRQNGSSTGSSGWASSRPRRR